MSQDGSGFWAGDLDGLIGRDDTLAAVRQQLGEGSRAVVIAGIPGAGKTAVLTVTARAAAADGWRVLSLTCHESERDLAFGVLLELMGSVPGAETIVERLLPSAETVGGPHPLRLRVDVLSLLEHLGDDRPTLVLLDDAQWCDESSLSVLAFVAHRLRGSGVSMLAAVRADAPVPLVDLPVVELPPLDEPEARVLLRHAGIELDLLTIASVLERSGGNPLALLELGRAAANRRGGIVPSSVEVAFGRTVGALPAQTRRLLALAAAGDGDLRVLARVVEPELLVAALAAAETAGLVEVSGSSVRFAHPLARAAAYSTTSAADRRATHLLLSEAYADDPERQVWHRAEATVVPDEDVAAALASSAEGADRRGACAEASRLMYRAAELSPASDVREQRTLASIVMGSMGGDFARVVQVGGRLRDEAIDQAVQIQAAHVVAYALAQTGHPVAARAALLDVLGRSDEADSFWRWASLTTLAVLTYRSGGDVDEVAAWLERSERDPVGTNPFPALVEASRAMVRMQIDPLARPPEILELVTGAPVPDYPLGVAATHEMVLGAAAWLIDEPEAALLRLGRAVDLMQRADAPGEITQTLIALALVQFATGDYDAVDQAGRLVVDIAEARNQAHAAVDGIELLARVAAVRGDAERARELCERVLLELPVGEALALEITIRVTMSWVRLAEHDTLGAWHELSWLFTEDGQPRHRHISYRELGHYAAAAARAGAIEELERVLAVADHVFAAPRPYHRLQLARARALAAGEDAEPWHREAVSDTDAGRWPFELANAQLEFGGWLRRRHRLTEARAQLQSAAATFRRLGTRTWEDLARAELRAAGVASEAPAPSAWSSLTGQEREVVRLAAAGLTNPEIAAALYLSPRTVSTHLYHAFPKLGVTSRGQLRDVMTVET